VNNTILDHRIERKSRSYNGTCDKDRWPLYTGIKPTLRELDKSIKSLSDSDKRRILENAGIIDKDGNIAEMYRP
jgi:hypothetical protein